VVSFAFGKMTISGSLGFCDKNTITWVVYKITKIHFSLLRELRRPGSRCWQSRCLVGAVSWFIEGACVLCSHPGRAQSSFEPVW
jgi:hypothetical protein